MKFFSTLIKKNFYLSKDAKTRKNNFENKIIEVKQQIKEHDDSRVLLLEK